MSTPSADAGSPEADRSAAAKRPGCAKRLVFVVLATCVLFLLAEGLANVAWNVKRARGILPHSEEVYCRYDGELGWVSIPSTLTADLYGEGRSLTINSQGLRGTRDHSAEIPDDTFRVVCLGDSFTLGFGVGDAQTYVARLDALDGVETVNMGQAGYGVDQSYLWYKRDGLAFECDLLLCAFIGPDFARMNHPDFNGYAKPVLRLEDGKITVGNVPVPRNFESRTTQMRAATAVRGLALSRLARRILGVETEQRHVWGNPAFDEDLARAVLDDLRRISADRGQDFAIVYLPLDTLIHREPARATTFLRKYAADTGTHLIDLIEVFGNVPAKDFDALFFPDNHYTELGHALVAESIARALRERFPAFPR